MATKRLNKADALKKLKKNIRDRERRFLKMSLTKQRMTIAQDVIDALKANKIKASVGRYVAGPIASLMKTKSSFDRASRDYVYNDDKDLRELIVEKNMPSCSACAIGSMFVCTVLRQDDITVGDTNDGNDDPMREYLKKYFDTEQLSLIESAFEQREFANGSVDFNELDDAIAFGKKVRNSSDRMIAIMKNIIQNKGKFDPPKMC